MSNKDKLLELISEDLIDSENLVQMLISFLSEDEAAEVLRLNGLDEYFEDDFIDEDDEIAYDPDEDIEDDNFYGVPFSSKVGE